MNQNENQRNKLQFEISAETGTLSYESTRKYFSILGFAIFGFSVASFLAQIILALATNYFIRSFAPELFSSSLANSLINYLWSFIPLYCVGLPVFLKIAKRLPKIKPLKQKMKFFHILAGLCICVALMISGSMASNTIMNFFENLKGQSISNPIEEVTTNSSWWLNLVFVAILAPIAEELLYRKILCTRLLPLGEGWAVVISAAVFALAHGNFYQCVYAFTLGLFFGFIYVKTGKLGYSIFYHFMINLLGGVVSPFLIEQLNKISPDLYNRLMTETDMTWFWEMMPEQQAMFTIIYSLLTIHSLALYALAIVGAIILIVAAAKKKLALQGGLIPPVKEGKFSALFLNTGVALSIAYFLFTFVLSLVSN